MAVLSLAACKEDETVAGYDGGQVWQLAELDGVAFTAAATLEFGSDGKVTSFGKVRDMSIAHG